MRPPSLINSTSPIGIFDSGLGGLTVLKKIQSLLPNEDYIYFGDTAHLPYGSKSNDCIIEYSEKIVNFLINKNVKAIIIACNSASSAAKDKIQNEYNIPIFEVISPAVEEATKATKSNSIGVIGTEITINSRVYSKKILATNENFHVMEIACPLLVPIIEEGLEDSRILDEITKLYLAPIINSKIDTLILGCTHYPIIKKQLTRVLPDKIQYITSGEPVGRWLKEYLIENNILNTLNNGVVEFYVSDAPRKFQELGSKFLNNKITNVQLV